MGLFTEIYSVAVATALLGKTKDEEIAEYLNDKSPKIIKTVREIQPIILDFSLSDEASMEKISQVFRKNNLLKQKQWIKSMQSTQNTIYCVLGAFETTACGK